jgi:hypothetical protein
VFKLACADEFLVVIDSVSATGQFPSALAQAHLEGPLSADMEKIGASLC